MNSNNDKLISVIIPFYSSLKNRLKVSVTSALEQSYNNIEVIVIDDYSPLSAKDELKDIQDNRLKIITHKENTNGGIARNTGINNALGEFIAFLDYDDKWYSSKIQEQLDLYNKNKENCERLVIYSKCKIIEGKRTFVRPLYEIKDNQTVGEYLFVEKQLIQTSGIFLATNIAKEVLFDNLKRHQDYQFCLSLEDFGCKFLLLDKITYEFIQISKLNDYNFSLLWLNKYSKYLNKNAVKGFKKLVIVRTMIQHKHYKNAFFYSITNRILFNFILTSFKLIIKKILKEVSK
jgi:glycosyltransferase involved in cell wall biosynthesis